MSLADWMKDSTEDLTEPLTTASVQVALKVWAMQSSIDKNENFAWWADLVKLTRKLSRQLLLQWTL
jgi:hypothetical protein